MSPLTRMRKGFSMCLIFIWIFLEPVVNISGTIIRYGIITIVAIAGIAGLLGERAVSKITPHQKPERRHHP